MKMNTKRFRQYIIMLLAVFLTLFGLLARVNEVKLSKGGIIQRIFKHCFSTAFLHVKKILRHFLS